MAAALRCEDEHASKEGCRRRKSSIDWENSRLAVKLAVFAVLVSQGCHFSTHFTLHDLITCSAFSCTSLPRMFFRCSLC